MLEAHIIKLDKNKIKQADELSLNFEILNQMISSVSAIPEGQPKESVNRKCRHKFITIVWRKEGEGKPLPAWCLGLLPRLNFSSYFEEIPTLSKRGSSLISFVLVPSNTDFLKHSSWIRFSTFWRTENYDNYNIIDAVKYLKTLYSRFWSNC